MWYFSFRKLLNILQVCFIVVEEDLINMLAFPTPDTWVLNKIDSLWLKMSLICLSWLPYTANHYETVQVFLTESSALMGKERNPLAGLYCDCSALNLTGLSFLWVFLSMPRNFCIPYLIIEEFFEDIVQLDTASYLTVLYMWMFQLCNFAEFHWFLLLVNDFKVIRIILLELGRIKMVLSTLCRVKMIYCRLSFCFLLFMKTGEKWDENYSWFIYRKNM